MVCKNLEYSLSRLIDLIQAADSSKIDLLEVDPFLYSNEDSITLY